MSMSDFLLSKNKKAIDVDNSKSCERDVQQPDQEIHDFSARGQAIVVMRMRLMKLLVLVVVGATVQKCQAPIYFIVIRRYENDENMANVWHWECDADD